MALSIVSKEALETAGHAGMVVYAMHAYKHVMGC